MVPTLISVLTMVFSMGASAQETDLTQTPNTVGAGIYKSLEEQIGAGRGDILIPDSSLFLIARDPFRAIVRGRQLFQRKFTQAQGVGPRTGDGEGDIESDASIVAGLADSCAACHGRPRGSAGSGGDVFTRPDSRDAPHLFGLGLQEMLADEITRDLRAIRDGALGGHGASARVQLRSKGIDYGWLTKGTDGSLDFSEVEGVDDDLRVKPFFAEGSAFAMRQFVVGALNNEMGLEAADPDLLAASEGARVVTPAGMVLDGGIDHLDPPPVATASEDGDDDGVVDEVDPALVDYLEFYLLNYFRPGRYEPYPSASRKGLRIFEEIGCASCHIPDLEIERDRRVADVDTEYDPEHGGFNGLFATAAPAVRDGRGRERPAAAASGIGATLPSAGHLHRLQAPRPRPELFGTQLRWHVSARVHDRAALGRRDDGTLRARRSQHQPARGYPEARRRGAGSRRRLRRPVGRASASGPRVSRIAGAVSASGYRIQS